MTLLVGTAVATLHFPDDLGLFGFGPAGGRGYQTPPSDPDHDTLQARALWLEHEGAPLLVLTCDLASGSRPIAARVREQLAARGLPLEESQLLLLGTHTHSAPGVWLGNLYDRFGGASCCVDARAVDTVVRACVQSAQEAHAGREPCRVGHARGVLWGAGRNRSLGSYLAEGGSADALPRALGLEVPSALRPEEQAIDPRMDVLAFVRVRDGGVHASWGLWNCHPATWPRSKRRAYHRDWVGVALAEAERVAGFAILHQGSAGDVTSLATGTLRTAEPARRVRALGARIGAEMRALTEQAARDAHDVEIAFRYRAFCPREHALPAFELGLPVILGSEEFDGGPARWVGESVRCERRRGPQAPKARIGGPLHALLGAVRALQPSPEHPVWSLRFGAHVWLASPFEITGFAAWHLERNLLPPLHARGVRSLRVIGLAGDYAGYVTTPAEYRAQNYEGGHTLYGSGQLQALLAHSAQLLDLPPPPPA